MVPVFHILNAWKFTNEGLLEPGWRDCKVAKSQVIQHPAGVEITGFIFQACLNESRRIWLHPENPHQSDSHLQWIKQYDIPLTFHNVTNNFMGITMVISPCLFQANFDLFRAPFRPDFSTQTPRPRYTVDIEGFHLNNVPERSKGMGLEMSFVRSKKPRSFNWDFWTIFFHGTNPAGLAKKLQAGLRVVFFPPHA